MLILNCEITIGDFTFNFVNELEISRSVDELTQGGYIRIPKNIIFKNSEGDIVQNIASGENPLFFRGADVTVKVGYKPRLVTIFEGFVSRIRPGFPLVFEVEDRMYIMKQKSVSNINEKNLALTDLLELIKPIGIEFEALDVNLGDFRIGRPTTSAQVLQYLRDNYGLTSYFREGDNVLVVGFAFDAEELPTTDAPIFEFGRNMINSDSLEYQQKDDQLIKLTAISIQPDNTKIEIEIGDLDGETRTLYQYNTTEEELRKFANNELNRLKYTGFKGTFTAFLEPRVTAGQVIELRHSEFDDKNGFYLVRSVTTNYGVRGGRQEIELDIRVE